MALFRRQKVGLVVGERAGTPVSYNGADSLNGILPYSGIEYRCSYVDAELYPEIETDENGFLVPDIPYDVYNRELGIEDYLQFLPIAFFDKEMNGKFDL